MMMPHDFYFRSRNGFYYLLSTCLNPWAANSRWKQLFCFWNIKWNHILLFSA